VSTAPPNDPRFPPEQATPQPGQFAPQPPPNGAPPPAAPYGNGRYAPPPPYPPYGQPEQFAPPAGGTPTFSPPPPPPTAYPPGAYGQGTYGQPPSPYGQQAPYGQPTYGYPQGGYVPPYSPNPQQDDARSTIGPERVPWHWYDLLLAGFFFIIIAVISFTNSGTMSDASTRDTATRSGLSRDAFLIANLVSSAVIYGLVLLLVWWRTVATYRVPWSALGVRRAPAAAFWLMIPVWIVMTLVAVTVSGVINQVFFGGQGRNPQIEGITGGGGFSWVALVCALLSAGIIAPVVEELFFRGMLYGWLRSRLGASGAVAAIAGAVALDALIFATIHGIGLILASIFVVGVALALVYERTKSVVVSIALHSLFNSAQVAAVFITLAAGIPLT